MQNLYGPTETTLYATRHVLGADRLAADAAVPIGRPLANTDVFVLDGAGRVVPAGVVGELFIGGAGLARGYHNRPELTANRFVHKQIGDQVRHVYRTGDLVRWSPDGNLEFVGRTDNQVKIRGFRVEPGEIEAALRGCPQIAEAVVIARAETPGDARLVAYVVGAGAGPELSGVRTVLREKLPEYLIPSAFVVLDAIPLTHHGKVDMGRLPAPDGVRPELAHAYTAPEGPVQQAIAAIWSEVLGVDRVGAHDNFFELGGHSLLVMQVLNRVELLTGFRISVKDFFLRPTVSTLCAHLTEIFQQSRSTRGA
jgi:acyl carrier protein